MSVWSVLLIAILATLPAHAQRTAISGRVTSAADSTALPGVTVIAKGTAIGTATDINGNFSLNVPSGATTLVFSYIGYATQEVAIGTQAVINVRLESDVTSLSEVVVTALGIERQNRELGYVTQKISTESITEARETNLVNQLAGKIAGVTVVSSPSGIGGSARVTIRGERSLNINNNQPLFVIDGLPINNNFVGSSGRSFQEADYGNGAGFINPDDVESITVLKGANAAALYGSRAANGVVLITTKSGKGSRGLGITYNANLTFETPLRLPDYQNVYGQGLNGEFGFLNGSGAGLRDGVDENWGPRMEGQLIAQHDSPTDRGFRAGDTRVPGGPGAIQPTPFLARPDNIRDFFDVGRTLTNNIAVTGSNDQGDFRLSYTNLNQKGIVPNTDLRRNTVALSGSYNLTSKFTARASVNYIKNESDNRPSLSYGTENIMYLFNCWYGRQIDTRQLRNYWQPGLEGLQQFNFNYNYHDNPYFNMYENTNGQSVDRIIGNITLNYQFTDWLSLQARTQTDFSYELRDRRRAFSTQRFPFGSYREEQIQLLEQNSDLLLAINRPLSESFSFSATLGGNRRLNTFRSLSTLAEQLTVPNVYNFGNSRVPLFSEQFNSEKRVNSIFGSAQIGFRNYLFLDITARNDWSSSLTLPTVLDSLTSNNSYFYPSASLSAVVSDMVQLPTFISYAQLRAGVAQVGNDTDPYQFTQPFIPQIPFGTTPTFSESGRIPNLNLKPEISTSQEYGLNLRFLQDRIGLDVTYYLTNSRNQIIFVPLSITTGYNDLVSNAGKIRNEGVEIMLNLVPVRPSANGFGWTIDLNFSSNRSKVLELTDNIRNYQMASRYVSVEARVGERMGDMYGFGYQRVSSDPASPYYDPSGQYVGQMVINDGRPVATPSLIKLGNYNPDWLGGIYNTFSFKGVNLGVLFDIRKGGVMYSHTHTVGREGGQLIETLEGRANGYDLTQPGNGVFAPGVVRNSDGSYHVNGTQPSDRELTAREWHTAFTLGRRVLEGSIFDASFVKLREVKLGYTLPARLLGNIPVRNVNLSLVGRNLALWSKVPHVDPETSSVAGGTIVPGSESVAIPTTRSYGFNLGFQF